MIRELWNRQMDARRVFSLVLAAVALGLVVLGLAAAPGFLAPSDNDVSGFARFSPLVGAAIGFGARAFLVHRRSGTRNGLLWAIAEGSSMALLLLGVFAAATAIGPNVSRNPTLGGDAWLGFMATAVVLAAASSLLWERNARRRRTATVVLVASGLIIGGLIGLRNGGSVTPIGAICLSVGIISFVVAMVQSFADLNREVTEAAS